MQTDNDLERRLRDVLRQSLDHEDGPDPTWDESPAARRVAEGERDQPRRWTLRVLLVAAVLAIGGSTVVLFGSPDDPPPVGPAANGWIAYTALTANPGIETDDDIWLVGRDQGARVVIGSDTDGVHELCPAFSPDGRHLAYGRVAGQGAVHGISSDGVEYTEPATYRDATLVVADVGEDGHVTDRFSVSIGDGTKPPCPVWSPDGDELAFGVPQTSPINPTKSAEGSDVWILTVADRALTVLPDLLATDLEFSPDGSLLGIASGDDLVERYVIADSRIHLYDLASGATRTLDGTLGALTFTWSPDGGRIAYQTGDADHALRLIDLATQEQRDLSAPYSANHGVGPVWSPDGASIVYQRQLSGERHEVVLVYPDDLLADGAPREEVIPLIQPGADADGSDLRVYPYWVVWSPDGGQLLFEGWTSQADPILGTISIAPDSVPDILVDGQILDVNPVYDEGPFVPIQAWQRLHLP